MPATTSALEAPASAPDGQAAADPLEPVGQLFRDLRSSRDGLSGREAARRLEVSGPNELSRRTGRRWPAELARQFTQPLAMLLGVAAVLAWVTGSPRLGIAIIAVIFLNAGFAFAQEIEVDMSTLTGESAPVVRSPGPADASAPLLEAAEARDDVGEQRAPGGLVRAGQRRPRARRYLLGFRRPD